MAMRLLVAALLAAAPATVGYAKEIKVGGTVTYVVVSEESSKLPDGRTVLRLHDKGIVLADDPKSPLHLAAEDCFDTVIMAADGSVATGAGYCDTFDKDGDAYWFSWVASGAGSAWNVYHGAGKFEGMTGGGTATWDIMLPDRFSVTFEGTLTMK
jgi:hypothetical protein